MTHETPTTGIHQSFERYKELTDRKIRDAEQKSENLAGAVHNRMSEIETALCRTPRDEIKSSDAALAKKFAIERKQHFQGELDVQTYRQYKSAFENYLRRNNAGADETKALAACRSPSATSTPVTRSSTVRACASCAMPSPPNRTSSSTPPNAWAATL